MLADSVVRWGEKNGTRQRRLLASAHEAGCPPEFWGELGGLGWLAVAVSEQNGGMSGNLSDMCLLAEGLGKVLLTEPVVPCGIMATLLMAEVADDSIRDAWLPDVIQGTRRIAIAAWEPGCTGLVMRPHASAVFRDEQWRLNGSKELMCGVAGANGILLSAKLDDNTNELGIFLVLNGAQGAQVENFRLYDGRHAAKLFLCDAPAVLLKSGREEEILDVIRHVIDCGTIAHCAEIAGVAQATFSVTRDYVTIRRQFGATIGSNQVIQHRLVELFVEIEEVKAFWRETAVEPESDKVAALAARTMELARHLWEQAIQLHGAIGMTEEYALSEYVRRLALSSTLFGAPHLHLERLAQIALRDEI